MHNILFWNARGVGNLATIGRLRHLVRSNQLDLIALMEPLVGEDRIPLICSQIGLQDGLSASSGKIWLLWLSRCRLSVIRGSDQAVTMQLSILGASAGPVFVTAVYGKHNYIQRRELWLFLEGTKLDVGCYPWCIGGDFNVTLRADEQSGTARFDSRAANDFQSLLFETNLHIPPTTGSPFSWMGKCRGRIRLKKLDYFLCNDRWLDVFPNGKIETLPRTTSDHAPLLFHVLSPRPSGARPFRFLNIWLQHPDFAELVKTSWSAPIAASGMFKLAGKLARLKAELKTWNRIAFGNIFERKNQSEQEVQDAEAALDSCPNSVNAARLDSAYRSLQLRLKAEEEYWRQRLGCVGSTRVTPTPIFFMPRLR
ncbi:hypothetical protein HPP92_011043 [Vanilla planifolia]|uniref:Endonuclease/exonuclease/phosphatase domain-containing protein n=1 Tax=Vanilla planifolia TaxID=51239 RepID=A0A835QUZ4_VANPL|nr:hypothetical protein HPP92_011043 [Vanilla planifolia]